MKLLLLVALCSAGLNAFEGSDAKGSICVATTEPPAPGVKSLANPAGENRIRKYSIKVDDLEPVIAQASIPVLIDGIPLDGKHRVKIRGDGKQVASFSFRFSDYPTTRLCMFFNSLYETWNLWDSQQGKQRCKCSQ